MVSRMIAAETADIPANATEAIAIAESQIARPQAFTRENAAEMARRSAEARKRNAEARELRLATALVQAEASRDSEEYVQAKLVRVRAQIALLDDKLEASKDPKEMKMCADALYRLYEVESYLSGRPKPGSRRPGRERPAREPRSTGPLDA